MVPWPNGHCREHRGRIHNMERRQEVNNKSPEKALFFYLPFLGSDARGCGWRACNDCCCAVCLSANFCVCCWCFCSTRCVLASLALY
jgi:hypothetical protein